MELYSGLTNTDSVEKAVEIVNENRTEYNELFTSDFLAAQYAFQAALDNGYGFDEDQLMAQLEALESFGGKFHTATALDLAKNIVKESVIDVSLSLAEETFNDFYQASLSGKYSKSEYVGELSQTEDKFIADYLGITLNEYAELGTDTLESRISNLSELHDLRIEFENKF